MSIVKLIDDYLIEFGNERFLEGWNGAEERIIKLLEAHSEQKFADNFQRNDDLVHEDVCKLCEKFNGLGVAIALIKAENK